MGHYTNHKSNYDKHPFVAVVGREQECWTGAEVASTLGARAESMGAKTVVIECYQGVDMAALERLLAEAFPAAILLCSHRAMFSSEVLEALFFDEVTDDEIFGYLTKRNMESFFAPDRVATLRSQIASCEGLVVVYGVGAAYIAPQYDLLVYADMARWEIQRRFRNNTLGNIGVDNANERASLKYKRAFFVDWRICDRFKRTLLDDWDFVLDMNCTEEPKLATGDAVREGLRIAAHRPFRVVPFFDPGPWGGQWMREVCDLGEDKPNYAWCFDCVPEENSLLLGFGDVKFEIPSIDLVFAHPKELLGEAVYGRFGAEFPIRFDFLDTMEGGNLSLQVHPLTDYIQQQFGMHYTQDESYYLLDATPDAGVYLGLREGVQPQDMLSALEVAQSSGEFDAERFVGRYPVRKHDHVLIPAGTIHCSGKGGMVLEISATPFIFTFKLWDWGRLGLDGRPRPINIQHGSKVIQWDRSEEWVKRELLNRVERVAEGEGWIEERTGLHEREFIETRRHWFTGKVSHHTGGGVNVLNLVEGREAVVESPTGSFEPFVVHYAETFIIPAEVGEYTIRPYGPSEGQQCATIKAYVRHNP